MAQLTIYKASAGSGKTFRLVTEYIKLLVQNPYNYRHILAVTFTNKATSEMKERILRDLSVLASAKNEKLRQLLAVETEINEAKIIENSGIALSLILHDYDRFSVNTIDSFFQSVLRSFARESGLFGSYEVNLDQKELLEEACDRMLLTVDSDKELKEWLLMMAENQLEEGKSWQVHDRIIELGAELEKESFQNYMATQGSLLEEREKLHKLKDSLIKTKKWYETETIKLGKQGLDLIQNAGLLVDDFKGGSRSFMNYFNYLANFRADKLEPTKTTRESVGNPDAWYTKTSLKKDLIQSSFDSINKVLDEAVSFYNNNYHTYSTACEIFKNIYALGLLSTLAIHEREIGLENNSLLLSESNLFLKKIIGNNDAPFIYEKAGNYFQNFMIDEFQDTSVVQWENFKPLIVNSLSENHSNLVVGDVKQSIYRWRNSDWQLLSKQIKEELSTFDVRETNLDSNWRSRREVVDFNNRFFVKANRVLQDTYNNMIDSSVNQIPVFDQYRHTISDAFSDVVQNSSSGKDGGFVQIQFINPKEVDYKEQTISLLIEQIERVQVLGFRASDIAILIRKNDQGRDVAHALLSHKQKQSKYNFEVVSDDSLFLSTSNAVGFLVGLLRYIAQPWNDVVKSSLSFEFSKNILPFLIGNDQNDNSLIDDFVSENVIDEYFPFFREAKNNPTKLKWANLSLTDLVAELEQRYSLNSIPGEQANLQAFKDVVHDFSSRESENLFNFLEWWDKFGNKIKVQSAGQRDAIRILSIHKSKGLEFPIVFVPFCDWSFAPDSHFQNILWCPTSGHVQNDFPILPVKFTKELSRTDFAESYFTEMLLSFIDNLNLLYVALTRPVDGLFVFSEYKPELKEVKSVSDLLNDFAGPDLADGSLVYEHGNLVVESHETAARNEIDLSEKIMLKTNLAESLRLHKNYEDFFDSDNENASRRVNEGTLIHEILSKIESVSDLEIAVKTMEREGKISTEEVDHLSKQVFNYLEQPLAKHWFDGTYRVLNETTIIDPDFHLTRPDRVMILDDQVVVVDYKTSGQVKKAHQKQVKGYADKIRGMGYKKVTGYVWYMKLGQILNVDHDWQGNLNFI